MKSTLSLFIAAATLCLSFWGCDLLEGFGGGYSDKWAGLVNETSHEVQVDRNTLTYGEHSYTVSGSVDYDFEPGYYDQQITATVEFTNIPSGYTEFKAVYENLLGKSLQGTAAMVPMAMEIYGRNTSTGERCFKLLCKDDATVSGIIRILKTKFPRSAEDEKDKYFQRYLPAALLDGADYETAYNNLTYPYVVNCGAAATLPQETKMSPYGTVYYTYIFADGWDSHNRGVDIFLPKGETLFKVQGCSSCYTQCKDIFGGPWQGLK